MAKISISVYLLFFSILSLAQEVSTSEPDSITAKRAEGYYQAAFDLLRRNTDFRNAEIKFDSALFLFEHIKDSARHVETLVGKSWCYIFQEDYEEAENICKMAYKLSEKYQNKRLDVVCRQLGIVYEYISDYQLSEKFMLKSRDIREEKYGKTHNAYAQILADLSVLYDRMGSYAKALEYRFQANDIYEKNGFRINRKINAHLNIGSIYYKFSDYKKMLEHSLKGLEMSLEEYGENRITALLLENAGIAYMGLGQLEKSREHSLKSLRIRSELYPNGHFTIGSTYANLASVEYRYRNYDSAAYYYRNSLEVYSNSLGENHAYAINALENIGVSYMRDDSSFRTSEASIAEAFLIQALEKKIEKYGENHIEIAKTYSNLGALNRLAGNYKQSLTYLNKSLNIHNQKMGEIGNIQCNTYRNLFKLYFAEGFYTEALDAINKAMVSNGSMLTKDPYLPPFSNSYNVIAKTFELIDLKIELLREINPKSAPQMIIQHIDTLIKITSQVKEDFSNRTDLENLVERYHHFMGLGVSESISLISNESNDKNLMGKAFQFAESAKGNLLVDQLQRMNAQSFAKVPDSLLLREKVLLDKLAKNKNKTAENDSIEVVIEEERFAINREINELEKVLKNEYPSYYSLRNSPVKVDLDRLKQLSEEEDLNILSYFVVDDAIYSFLITKNKLSTFKKELGSKAFLDEQISRFRDGLINVNEEYIDASKELYQLLFEEVKPVLEPNSKLVIIPDNTLALIPFELLMDDSEKILLEDYAITYSYSIKQFLLAYEAKKKAANQYVGFAPSFNASLTEDPVRGEISQLPGALKEVNTVLKFLKGRSYLNEEASESNFKNIAGEYSLIHLATHAIMNDREPDKSRLMFNIENDTLNDGDLHAYEIYNMDINSDLVTLSACNTGMGKIQNGEGLQSLGKAFLYAGCPNLIMSHWKVNDESTAELMGYLYKNLNDGLSKDEALRQAKLTYLKNADPVKSHPYYWAGFTFMGNPEPLNSNEESRKWWLLIFPVLIVIFLAARKRQS
ncbi:CHAT domain-containing protein [Ekhidna sp. To15]|uniref:CHAT domain-containing protein n=1 Tax=Ekhidna sp. To15 TaxID=3395267 RepID=UPI003F523DAC